MQTTIYLLEMKSVVHDGYVGVRAVGTKEMAQFWKNEDPAVRRFREISFECELKIAGKGG